MEQRVNRFNSFDCGEELESRIDQMRGILITLEAAMESEQGFITIQPVAKHAVTAALNMAEECGLLNKRACSILRSQ